MNSSHRWLVGSACLVAGILLALAIRPERPAGAVESVPTKPGDARLDAEASGGLAREMASNTLARSAAVVSHHGAITALAIDRVFSDPAVERARNGKFPPERVIVTNFIRPIGAYDVLIRDSDPGRLPRTIFVSEWWREDFEARHGTASPGATQLQCAATDPQWVEEDTRFSLDPMMKIDRLNLNGSVIDKEAETPFAGDMTDNQGAMVEAGYFVVFNRLEPFLRYEWPGPEPDALDGPVSSMGVNYYLVPSRVRFSVSTVFTSPGQAGAGSANHFDRGGMVRDGSRDETSVRGQFQLLF